MSETPVAAGGAAERGGTRAVPLSRDRLLQDWREAHERAHAYAGALGIGEDGRDVVADAAVAQALEAEWAGDGDAVSETLRAVRAIVQETIPAGSAGTGEDPFLDWRIDAAIAGRAPWSAGGGRPRTSPVRDGTLCSTPPLTRRSMAPQPLDRSFLHRLRGRQTSDQRLYGGKLREIRRGYGWTRVAHRRRFYLLVLVLVPTTIASGFMSNVLPHQGQTWLELAITIFFGALFGWISIGFWTAVLGFFTLVRRRDRFAITNLDGPVPDPAELPREARTAIVMPIADEPVDRVFAGLRAIHRSLERAGALQHFHFFVLSDSKDPGGSVREEEAWFEWCRAVDGFDRIFYRRRQVRLERKSGNVADFCRRWGAQYRYMIMLDADSVMTGDTLLRLVRLMERHPDVGMIQTAPTAVNRRSLFARVQQFASRVYGPMFAAGLHYWQLGDGQYWGHNTIIRVAPFMEHCALPRLPGREPLGGEILSHDFVEAALMGRAGWTLWLAYDLGGSYEEVPSTLLEEMRRDRRWCQGNLQHLRLLFTEGLFGAHRALFLNGALSYMSALLWNAFLILSTISAIWNALTPPEYFPHGPSLFPEWPIWRPAWALALLAVIGMILYFPKALSIVLVATKRREARLYGGLGRLTLSVLLEIVLSSLLAPIRMVFHSRFVGMNLLGRTVGWKSQVRGDDETKWGEALRHHALDMVVASAWGVTLFWLNPHYFWWVTPIIGALVLAVPVSVLSSRVGTGDRARRLGLFLIPEESQPPHELRDLDELLRAADEKNARLPAAERDGFIRAVVDPYVSALHRALLGRRRSLRASIRAARRAILEGALARGPTGVPPKERRLLLHDPELVDALHAGAWALPDREIAARWGRVGVTTAPSVRG